MIFVIITKGCLYLCINYTDYTMAKKLICEECSYHSLIFTAENIKAIRKIQARYVEQGKQRSVETVVNTMLSEWRVDRQIEQIEIQKADDSNNKQAENITKKK